MIVKQVTKPILSFHKDSDRDYYVEYSPYDPDLPQVFQEIERLVRSAAGSLPLEHIGSSSIPGLGGRNVVDVAIPAEEQEQPAIREALYELGFEESPFSHYLPLQVGRIAFKEKEYAILLYVLSPESEVYRDWIRFRDYMRSNPEDVLVYDAVKREALAAGRVEGEEYQVAKTSFLNALMAKINR